MDFRQYKPSFLTFKCVQHYYISDPALCDGHTAYSYDKLDVYLMLSDVGGK